MDAKPVFKSLNSSRALAYTLDEKLHDLETAAQEFTKYYYTNKKPKKNSTKKRILEPSTSYIKHVQKKLNSRILQKFPFPNNVVGGVSKKTVRDNALIHLKQPVVVALDIKNCFSNIKNSMVYDMFRKEFGFSTSIASLLTRLTTFRGHVPQGAPTSSSIANLCLLPMHREISEYCLNNGICNSLWVDDITLSGKMPQEHIQPIIDIVMKYGLSVSDRKIIIMPASIRQEVTGVVVNSSKPSISLSKIKKYKRTVINSTINETYKNKLVGQLAHVGFINPTQKKQLERLLHKHKTN